MKCLPQYTQNMISCEMRFNPCEVRLNQTSENFETQKTWKKKTNLKLQFGWRRPLVVIFNQPSCCWQFWMAPITKNHQNSYHGSQTQNSTKNSNSKPKNLKLKFKLKLKTQSRASSNRNGQKNRKMGIRAPKK